MTEKTEIFWGEIAPCTNLRQFYEDDRILLDTLHGFIYGGLKEGEGAVVIATPKHIFELEKRLIDSGIDVAAVLKDDQYIPLNAEETLGLFMVNNWPDDERFAKVITDILMRAGKGGRRVRAFGEMVALLWAKGLPGATVRLEHIWNKLTHTENFTLFCAYPKSGITKDLSQSVAEICAAHSKVVSDSQPRLVAAKNDIVE